MDNLQSLLQAQQTQVQAQQTQLQALQEQILRLPPEAGESLSPITQPITTEGTTVEAVPSVSYSR